MWGIEISRDDTNARLISDTADRAANLFVDGFRRGWTPVYSKNGK